MENITAELVRSALENAEDFEPRSYSGRGMYGAECIGVVVDDGDAVKAGLVIAAEVARRAAAQEGADTEDVAAAVEDMIWQMPTTHTDSMGFSTIVYWPTLAWSDSEA